MAHKINRVGTPGIGGVITRETSHALVSGDFASLYGTDLKSLNIASAAATAYGNYAYRNSAIALTPAASQGCGISSMIDFSNEIRDGRASHEVFEWSIAGFIDCGSDISVNAFCLPHTAAAPDGTVTADNFAFIPGLHSYRNGDSLQFQGVGQVSMSPETVATDVAHIGVMICSLGASNAVTAVRLSIGLRKLNPNDGTFPRYPDSKTQA